MTPTDQGTHASMRLGNICMLYTIFPIPLHRARALTANALGHVSCNYRKKFELGLKITDKKWIHKNTIANR